ncbi:hypothetical protein [Butyrivibrio sp. AE3003]|uniref:hypothetical protein n=1 Tax=Butyrivibrio sp. AE3003 TaxID=1496721 RepID=UPI00047BA1A0|nr:hypothetical protein [Butyrivibrio sp. AE3003]
MKKEITKIMTIIKAAPQLKSQIFIGIFLFVGGVFCEFSSDLGNTGIIGLSTCVCLIYQSIMISSGSSIVQSSASAKKLQTLYPFILQMPFHIIIFALLSWHRVYLSSKPIPDMSADRIYAIQCGLIILYSIAIFIISISEIITRKFFVFGVICICITYAPIILSICFIGIRVPSLLYKLTLTASIAAGFAIVITGSLLSILVANLLYKYPISAHVMKANNKA